MLPDQLQRFFWDAKFSEIDPQKNAPYIVERLLERGDLASIHWMLQNYSSSAIIQTLKKTRSLSSRSASFWALYFNLNRSELACTQKSWPRPQPVVSKT